MQTHSPCELPLQHDAAHVVATWILVAFVSLVIGGVSLSLMAAHEPQAGAHLHLVLKGICAL